MDPWPGHSISYYYFGYLMAAMLIRVTGVSSALGITSLRFLFGMTAAGLRRALGPLESAPRKREMRPDCHFLTSGSGLALLAPLMMLAMGNWFGGLDMIMPGLHCLRASGRI